MNNDINMTLPESRAAETKGFREELNRIQNSQVANENQDTANENQEIENESVEEYAGSDSDADVAMDDDASNSEKDFADSDDDTDPGYMIPKGRFNKVIEQKKRLQKQIEEEKAERIRAQTELDLYNKAMEKFLSTSAQGKEESGQQEGQSFEPLDYEAHQHYLKQQTKLQQELDTIKQTLIQSQFTQVLTNQEQAFSRVHPDFSKAFEYLEEKYTQMYSSLCDSAEEARSAAKQQWVVWHASS